MDIDVSLQPVVIMGKAQPHVAGVPGVDLVICGVLPGYLHQRASLWLAENSGVLAPIEVPVAR